MIAMPSMIDPNETPIHLLDAEGADRREKRSIARCVSAAKYKAAHRDKVLAEQAASRQRWADDPEYRAAQIDRMRLYKAENAEKLQIAQRAAYQENKVCLSAAALARYHGNKEEWKARTQKWREAHPEDVRSYSREYRQNHIDEIRVRDAVKYAANRDENRVKSAARYHADPGYQTRRYHAVPERMLAVRLRARLHAAVRKIKAGKAGRTSDLLGCDPSFLRHHIEAQFDDGMTWENHSQWHVDHIKPVCKFDLTDADQQRAAFHYSNLRPLWAADNLSRPRQNWSPEPERIQ